MGWTAPPTRREVSLLLFCLTAFILGYNLEVSLSTVGLDAPTRATFSKKIGVGGDPGLERDGRKPRAWRDRLEREVVGDWEWDEGEVLHTWGEDKEGSWERYGYNFSDLRDSDITWRKAASMLGAQRGLGEVQLLGPINVDEGRTHWGSDVPMSRIVSHVPGFTILDNAVYANGTMFIVSPNDLSAPLSSIASSSTNPSEPPSHAEWQVIRPDDAAARFGDHAQKISGVSFISTDPSTLQDNYTLISLWRAYSTLDQDQDITSTGSSTLPPPLRLIYPNIQTYSDHQKRPEAGDPEIPRVRSRNGIHPFLVKAAFPTAGVWYAEDWEDLKKTEVPFLLERVVLLDRAAAQRSGLESGLPFWANAFTRMEASPYWWAPIRKTLAGFLSVDLDEEGAGKGRKTAKTKPVITYITRQNEEQGARLRPQDHQLLVDALRGLEKHYGYEVHVVSRETEWKDRMSAILRSSMILSVYGDHLADAVFIQPWPRSMVMEFFPPDTFVRDRELPAKSMGVQYMAWWYGRKFSGDSLPSSTRLPDQTQRQEIALDASAVAQAVREELSRKP
ncbi:hypothetical protein GLOTRDRAFT_132253 [Gloeophyllum trabeum ATCC 11539]|uniref:Uncharacterized protein n=1 Tax=Gloeophyllum trabeum (strain ATCC 11539 / FP-39264 / Madison 617) TaxID=670483 RepID=S7RDW7_GLOTA|nr:uncharacterized protein GLOTRDRAFT_132253 [Gloeophyllum trabeum ATCC 11539]EPQ52405.1 hypothetical protein GLOTRDRAFT_132253 [Gloeophyllum trabeum ATCC 11539]